MKTIGLLTSGGDAPGANACVAAAAAHAERHGVSVRGIMGGFRGLVQANSVPVGSELAGLARRGGSFLGVSRNGALEQELAQQGIAAAMSRCCVDGLVVLGGGGSLCAAARASAAGAPVVGVPCTIDNDVFGTDYSIGFDSAVNKAVRAADEILDTAESLSERVFIIETLGGKAGHIALATAYAVGADAVFVPEVELNVAEAARRIKAKTDAGATHGLVVLCENLGTNDIARELEEIVGRRVRITVLGHTQRGGNPTYFDRARAREFGEVAVDTLLRGDHGTMVAYVGGRTISVPLCEVAGKTRPLDVAKYHAMCGGETARRQ